MATTAETDVSQLSFEAALARLEEIVRTLEKGEAPLDQSIELYQEGDRLQAALRGAAQGRAGADRADRVRKRRQAGGAQALRCRLRPSTGSRTSSTPRRGASRADVDGFFAELLAPDRRQPRAALRSDAPRRDRRRQAASSVAHRRRFAAVRDRPRSGASRRLRDRGDPRLFADPRRSAVHGRCRPAARQGDRAQGLRRGGGGACRRQPPCAGVRDSRPSRDPRGPVGPVRPRARAGARRRPDRHGRRADDGPRRRGRSSSTCRRSPGCSS